jgi:hypothetical protein
MTFDKPEHQQIVAQLIEQANFPGKMLELAIELKHSVANAAVNQLSAIPESANPDSAKPAATAH